LIQTSDGTTIDLRNIRSPIVVFCSKGDNVTPPQQALGWIVDLYDNVDDIRQHGQTIVYTIHESIGHLGIFVSAGVARKEHGEFSSNIDLIDVLPPGLYEAVFEAKGQDTASHDLVSGEWVMRCEARTLDDIRALGGNDAEDERRFAAAARLSEINLALYRTFAQPVVRAMMSAPAAEWLRRLHPLRLQYELLSDKNPWMASVRALASATEENRKPATADNPFLALQKNMSEQIVAGLDAWRDLSETFAERMFLSIYGSPALQAAVGIDPTDARPQRKAGKDPLHRKLVEERIAELKARIGTGGLRECLVRGMLYVGMPRAAVDERGFEAIRRLRATQDGTKRPTLAEFKAMVREQYFMLLVDPEAAVAAIPDLLPDREVRRKALATIRQVLSARGEIVGEVAERLQRIALLLSVEAEAAAIGPAGRPGEKVRKAS
jgi:hypothetical protein